MSSFDFVLILLSFVYALALGHLLQRVGGLLIARERVRFSGLLALAIVNAVTQVYIDWLAMWDFRTVGEWDLFTVTLFFFSSILLFLMCVAVSPEAPDERPVDMEAFYWKNYRLFYGLYLILLFVFVAMSTVYLRTPTPELALQQSLANLPYTLVTLFALFSPARWAQWTAGIALFVLTIAWPVVFSAALH
ncbi:hypothetical protein [Terricaulis sp.]|uniref:hypothetical protein n=1 Tax=Terricaulis sp. TaxID=2768686 RepID=UPI002AC3CB75|nr:hypothetical protein [Terricaulis sp.]MDZ4691405.1 hypothetical protein [Terricaulis sp.]